MNRKIYLSILTIFFFLLTSITYNLFAQKQDSIFLHQLTKLQTQTNKNNEVIAELKYQLNTNKDIDIAVALISWTSVLLAALGVFFTIGLFYWGYTAHKNVKEIESYKEKLSKEIKDLEVFRTNTQKDLLELKVTFEADKENLLSAIIPIIEGHWYSYQGENKKAIESYTTANKIMPTNTFVFCELNKLLLDIGDISGVIENIESFTGVDEKENRNLKQLLINAYRKKGEYDIAGNLIKQLPQYKEDGMLCYELGTIKLLTGYISEAEVILVEAYRIYSKDKSDYIHAALINLALCRMLMDNKDFKENLLAAKSILKLQLKKTPKQPYISGCLGLVSFAENDYDTSITYFEKSYELKLPIMNAKSFLERIQLIESFCDVENETYKKLLSGLNTYIYEKEINA